jgi:hypothetical protein
VNLFSLAENWIKADLVIEACPVFNDLILHKSNDDATSKVLANTDYPC